jgi:sigma-E factor negative regulatory protein RseA
MRGDGNIATLDVARQVREAVEREIAVGSPPAQPVQRRVVHWKPLAGVGVAASVALLALLGISTLRESDTANVPALASGDTVPQVAGVGSVQDGQWDRIEPRIEERLSGYLVNHSEYAASRAVQGVMPYVRIVGFDDE